VKWTWPFHAIAGAIVRRSEKRSPHWPALEKSYLRAHPTCAACGAWILLNVHHVIPVHVDPKKELDLDNLITLCAGPKLCHFIHGHRRNWKSWNPDVRADAAKALASQSRGAKWL